MASPKRSGSAPGIGRPRAARRPIGRSSLSRPRAKPLVPDSARWQNVPMPSSPQCHERIGKAHALDLAISVELIRLWRERAERAEAELEEFHTAARIIID